MVFTDFFEFRVCGISGQLTLCNAHMPGIHPGLMNITTMIPRRRVKEGIVHRTVYFLGIKLLVQES